MATAAEHAELIARLAEIPTKLAQVEDHLAACTAIAALTQQPNQNSANSHQPPASDGPGAANRLEGGRTNNKEKSKRKRAELSNFRGTSDLELPCPSSENPALAAQGLYL